MILSIHSYFEIIDRNPKSGRFMKCRIFVSHCVGRWKFVICLSSVNFQSFSEFSDLNIELSS